MGRIAAKNVAVAIGALLPMLVIDYLSVRSGLNQSSAWLSAWITVPALFVAPVGFFWANWPLVGPTPKIKQVLALTAVALLATTVWFLLLAWSVVGNFHIVIGGRL